MTFVRYEQTIATTEVFSDDRLLRKSRNISQAPQTEGSRHEKFI